jgi:hypothetical protein
MLVIRSETSAEILKSAAMRRAASAGADEANVLVKIQLCFH